MTNDKKSLFDQYKQAKQTEQAAIAARRKIEQALLKEYDELIQAQLDKDYQTGTATITDGNVQITITVPKRVVWDNDQLAVLYQKIKNTNEDPADYLQVKYSVSETAYKSWPEIIRSQFTPAREVRAGSPSFKIKE